MVRRRSTVRVRQRAVRKISIQVPGHGNVLADHGTITIDFTTDPWTVLHEGGPHPFFHEGYGGALRLLGELGTHCRDGCGRPVRPQPFRSFS